MATPKCTLAGLPLANQLLTAFLTPDPNTPSAANLDVLYNRPSVQRRARLLAASSHFSFVSPLPLPFPYKIEAIPEENQEEFIEKWLAAREAVNPLHNDDDGVEIYYPNPETRDGPRHLIGLAENGLRDCLPNLDVGDAFTNLGVPALTANVEDKVPESNSQARQEIIDVLSGYGVLRSLGSSPFAPWSLRYSGHQFGSFAGQLGDGRAISIFVTPQANNPDLTWELQLKGAGRTPFSRTADGLAVARSSIREYLCSEAMHALGIPTTRSLALVSLPDLPVERERTETACILTRMAPSFIRIGSFEALNAPMEMFFFGGGQQKPDLDALRLLGEWVKTHVLNLDCADEEAWGSKLVLESAKRNAEMVAGWQAYGFMHGVINTDNVSILGLTIDYGPYAFMDVFDPLHICNHTDSGGRYSYKYQPTMIIYALRALVDALAPLIGAELSLGNKAVSPGWAKDVSEDTVKKWTAQGKAHIMSEMERVTQETTSTEYGNLMRKRLGLRLPESTDESRLFAPLLAIMSDQALDFHGTFRTLCNFKPSMVPESTGLDVFIASLIGEATCDHKAATTTWLGWLETYARRITEERAQGAWPGDTEDVDTARKVAARAANPRFVLRQWLLEEVIAKVEQNENIGKRVLAKVLYMASNPFEPWGDEDGEQAQDGELDDEAKEEQRFCGMGDKRLLGFQCSCSS